MSDAPPRGNRPLRFQPASDDKSQLDAFLKGVFQQYLRQRSPQQQPGALAPNQERGNLNPRPSVAQAQDATARASQVTSSASRRLGRLKDDSVDATSASTTTHSSPLAATSRELGWPIQRTGSVGRSTEANAPLGSVSSKPLVATPQGSRHISSVNHDLIERQLNSIARASLLRAKTMDINAPDPEQDSPPGETAIAKRRRKERINGRRKRARKLIEMDTLNEKLVDLVDINKNLKTENSDLRQKIAAAKRRSNSQRSQNVTALPAVASADTCPSQELQVAQKPQAIGKLPQAQGQRLEIQALQLKQVPCQAVPTQSPNQQLRHQESLSQQQLLSALLGGLSSSPSPNQRISQFTSPPLLSFQQPQQMSLQASSPRLPRQQLLAHQLTQLQHQQLQVLQQHPQLTGLLQTLTGTSPSNLYAVPPPSANLAAPAASPLLRQALQAQVTASPVLPVAGNPNPTASAAAPAADRPRSPVPRNVKELKEWMQRQREEGKRG